jgi:AcrR family transcriptional regulator
MDPQPAVNAVAAPSAKRRRRKDARPSEIVAAALGAFAEQGFAATRLEDVADRAGTSKGTIYLYFATKEALFEAVVRAVISPVLDQADLAVRNPDQGSAEQLRLVIETVYRELVGTERRQIMRMMIAEAGRFPSLVAFYHREVVGRAKALLGTIVARGVARGEFRDGPATRHPEAILGPAIMAAIWKMLFDAVDPLDLDAFMRAHIDLVLRGIVPGDHPPTP